jgi:hypothetical protein
MPNRAKSMEHGVKRKKEPEKPSKPNKPIEIQTRKKIGIKYCGGCNPGYERVEMIQRVQFRFNDRFLFLRHDEPDIDVLVLMSGCHRACAGKDLNTAKIPHCLVTGENDFNNLINWLKSLNQKGDF